MSEADRSRLYDWLCEQTDEPLAEYVMSCLSTVPLPELATKADVRVLRADIDKLDGKIDILVAQREADRDQYFAQREADRGEYFAQREADRDQYLAQRKADRDQYFAQREADRKGHQADHAVLAKRISRLTFWLPFEVLGALAAVVAVTEWLRG